MLSKPMLTVHEVAALLKIKEATVRTWLNSGELPAAKFGKEWRVAEKDLRAFVEARMNTSQNDSILNDSHLSKGKEHVDEQDAS